MTPWVNNINFLDIIFRLEREFVIRISRSELLAEPFFQEGTRIVSIADPGEESPVVSLRYRVLAPLGGPPAGKGGRT
jgi:hypothetical protein